MEARKIFKPAAAIPRSAVNQRESGQKNTRQKLTQQRKITSDAHFPSTSKRPEPPSRIVLRLAFTPLTAVLVPSYLHPPLWSPYVCIRVHSLVPMQTIRGRVNSNAGGNKVPLNYRSTFRHEAALRTRLGRMHA